MPPKFEDQLSSLTEQVGNFVTATSDAITATNKKIDDLTEVVETLADQLKDEAARQTTSSTRVDRQLRATTDAVYKVAARAGKTGTLKASVSLLRPTDPPDLSITRMGSNHYDWLQQSLAAIRFWNPEAAQLLEDKSLSLRGDGSFYMDPALAATNAAVFAMISKAVAGKARAHLTDTFQKYAADSDMDPGELSDLEHDSDAGTPSISGTHRWTEQRQFMDTSAYLAWQALSQLDDDYAQKWLDDLQSKQCDRLDALSDHLDEMSRLYQKYSGCIDPGQLSSEQPMLSRMLTSSLPDFFLTHVNASFRGQKRKQRTWSKTMRAAREILT